MSKQHITDIPDLIDKLGGLTEAARFFGEQPQTVWNWRDRQKMPANLFLKHHNALGQKGIVAPPALWGQEHAA